MSISDGDHQAPPKASSGVPFITISSISSGSLRLQDASRFVPLSYYQGLSTGRRAKSGDVLYSVTGSIGIPALVENNEPFVFQRHIALLRPAPGLCDPRWLTYMLASPAMFERASTIATGTAQLTIPLGGLRELRIPAVSLSEQRRIVVKLDALTAHLARARAELDRAPVLAKKLRKIALVECFSFEDDEGVDLRSRLLAVEAGKNMRCDERPPQAGERGVVKVSAVTWGRFDAVQSKTLPPDYEPPEKARIKAGDLLISRANTLELVGAVVLVDEQPTELFLSDKILRLVVDDSEKRWIMWFLRSPQGRAQIENLATGNQLSMRNISQDALRRIRLPFPEATIRECRIKWLEATFTRAERFEAEAARARALIDRLESAILAKAFRGELVPQNPADEPASGLLNRIRTQRAAAPT